MRRPPPRIKLAFSLKADTIQEKESAGWLLSWTRRLISKEILILLKDSSDHPQVYFTHLILWVEFQCGWYEEKNL
jgi:hypothetical protein